MIHYPFTALVGQSQLKAALLLNAVDPGIGGVLICGEKGTAKSTAARALAELLPVIRVRQGCPCNSAPEESQPEWAVPEFDAAAGGAKQPAVVDVPVPFVELPLGATEDRVLGTLDFERALREGRRAFQPGLLARAHRGILYIDEVNLLADHLVDVLLDAAAMGVNRVQREGVEAAHAARFLLIGTMNPEEGELRPQLLDRFGLMVQVAAPRDPQGRVEVVRRRMAFDAQPAAFAARWQAEQQALRQRVVVARQRVSEVQIDDQRLTEISRICCEAGVEGMRADIVMQKTARTLAAWNGRHQVIPQDILEAAELVLPHRRRGQPLEPPGPDREQSGPWLPPPPPDKDEGTGDGRQEPEPPHARSAGQQNSAPGSTEGPEQEPEEDGISPAEPPPSRLFASRGPEPVRPIELAHSKTPAVRGTAGRRNRSARAGSGRYVRAVPDSAPADLAVDATLRSAAQHGAGPDGRPVVRGSDLHRKQRVGQAGTLVLFIVDASGSMAARRRMEAVKGAVLGLLADARQQRDRVGVIAFRGAQAELLLAPTRSIPQARQALESLPTGGRTPLAHALRLADQTLSQARRSDPELLVLAVLLTDGKANVALPDGTGDPHSQALAMASRLARHGAAAVLLDTDTSFVRLGRARDVARALGAEYLPLEGLTAESLTLQIRRRRSHVASPAQKPGTET